MDHRIPALINGRPCVLAFDMAAAYTLQETYGLGFKELAEARQKPGAGQDLKLLSQLLFAMTRSMDEPPSEKDIQRTSMEELWALRTAVETAFRRAAEAVPGKADGAAGAAAASAGSSGTGAARRSRRSSSAGSRRRSSGG